MSRDKEKCKKKINHLKHLLQVEKTKLSFQKIQYQLRGNIRSEIKLQIQQEDVYNRDSQI